MFDAYRTDIVLGGLCCLLGNLTQVILPFVLKYLITFATDAFVARQLGHEAPAIGTGIGWVFGLTAMQILGSIGNNHFMYRGMVVGGQLRSALISLIFQKAMTISGRAKAGWEAPTVPPQHIKPDSDDEKNWYAEQMGKKVENKQGWSNGRIINLMSTDTNRVDMASGWFHMIWVAPLSMLVTIALLLINLNYSALPGIALFLIAVPLMSVAVRSMFRRRLKANKITDKRVSLTQEVLQAIRFVKLYAWEMNFLDRIDKLRHDEIRTVQIILSIRNAINAVGVSIPLFSSMLAFITYSLSRHPLNPAPIFSSLTLFNQLRFPLVLLPMIIGLVTDALSSVGRIEEFLFAEDLVNNMETVKNAPGAVRLVDASFTWEKVIEGHADSDGISKQEKKQAKEAKKAAIRKGEPIQSESTQPHAEKEQREPFKITNLNIEIGRQEFVAVVGGVGSGKSSLLAALAGDMRKISGTAVLGASRAFCPQNAWIQNATVQDNITFGSELDESVMEQVIDACTLRQDLEVLPHGRYTEIGERGINLSGGQKQRVNLARAIYSGAEILLMDDPLSAVDAHVGHHIMEHAICGLLKDKCRILATHQLHVLHRCDRIMMMADGKITAFDTFDNLMTNNERFQEMMSTAEWEQEERVMETTSDEATDQPISIVEKTGDKLMQEEGGGLETSSGNVYFHYFKAAGSIFVLPFLLLSLAMSQGGNIVTNLWLAWWSSDAFGFSTGTYVSSL
jgi:ABC-type multidrug transport system fused ATPase/permease subunit